MIEQLYAILGVGPDGIEGIVTYLDPNDNVMKPLVGSAKRIDEMKSIAIALQNVSGATLQLVVFDQRKNLEMIR